MKKVLIAADEVDKWSQLCEGLKNEWECTTVNLDVFEKFHTIAVYDAVLMLVRNDNGKLGRLIWEVRQYSRAPIIVVIPGIQAVKKYIEWGCRSGISTSFGQLDQHVPVCITQTFRYHMEHWKKKRKAGDHKERKTSN